MGFNALRKPLKNEGTSDFKQKKGRRKKKRYCFKPFKQFRGGEGESGKVKKKKVIQGKGSSKGPKSGLKEPT